MYLEVGNQKQKGFTIVELLIVVVVIAILAAITIVSYNGIQTRAADSSAKAEISENVKSILNDVNVTGANFTTAAIMSAGTVTLKFNTSNYKVLTYCTNGTEFVFASETKNGKKYYSKASDTAVVNNDAIDSFLPCASLSVAGAQTTYANLPAVCAGENATCTFSGTATLVYGSQAQGRFNRLANQTSPVTCSNAVFGDPASGFSKACYVYPN